METPTLLAAVRAQVTRWEGTPENGDGQGQEVQGRPAQDQLDVEHDGTRLDEDVEGAGGGVQHSRMNALAASAAAKAQ